MASSAFSTQKQAATAERKSFIGGTGFDWATSSLGFLLMSGLYLDGWAHGHGKVDKTFFTPWHAALYSAYLLLALVIAATIVINHTRGYRWFRAIPRGYELATVAAPLFMVAAIGDLIWHTLFGFEIGVEQLLSPTHLLLATSGVLLMSGSLRSFWLRSDAHPRGWGQLLPMLLSLMASLMVFTFFTEFIHPFSHIGSVIRPNGNESLTAGGILLESAILMGFLLLTMQRWQLPAGSLTAIITIYTALMSVLNDQYRFVPFMLVVGIIADLLYWLLKPSTERTDALRLFAFLVPLLMYLAYFLTLLVTGETIYWSIHMWLGTSFMAGLIGLTISVLIVPFQAPRNTA